VSRNTLFAVLFLPGHEPKTGLELEPGRCKQDEGRTTAVGNVPRLARLLRLVLFRHRVSICLLSKGKGKGKVHPRTGHEGPEGEWSYSSTLSVTPALDGVDGQRYTPAALYPRERPGTRCIGGWVGPRGRSGRVQKISPPQGFDPLAVQPVASRYTD
jgi:hypothetical protein